MAKDGLAEETGLSETWLPEDTGLAEETSLVKETGLDEETNVAEKTGVTEEASLARESFLFSMTGMTLLNALTGSLAEVTDTCLHESTSSASASVTSLAEEARAVGVKRHDCPCVDDFDPDGEG